MYVASARTGPSKTRLKVPAFRALRVLRQRFIAGNGPLCDPIATCRPHLNVPPKRLTAICRGLYPVLTPVRHGSVANLHQLTPPCHLYIEIDDLFMQSISVYAQQIGAFRLISAGRIQRDFQQGPLYFAQDSLI